MNPTTGESLMDFKKITPKPGEQMSTTDIMRNAFEEEPSGQNSSTSEDIQSRRQRRIIDIEAIQKIKPTAERLEAEALRTSFYQWRKGAERISREDFNAAKLIKQLNDIRIYGTDKPGKKIQQVRYQVREQRAKEATVHIKGRISTDIYAMIAHPHRRNYTDRAGMTQMMKEYSEQADLIRQIRSISTILRRGKEMQKAMLRALQRRVRRQTPRGKQIAMHQEQEPERIKPQEIVPAEPLVYEISMENSPPYGEEKLHQLQHDIPETYRIAIQHIQRMREQGERPEQ
jgi:hypothetical protein